MKRSYCLKGFLNGVKPYGRHHWFWWHRKAAANLYQCPECKIYAINSSGSTQETVNFIGTLKDLGYVLKESDIVASTIALNKKTHNLVGKRELKLMKTDAVSVNVARAALIDEDALYEHPQYNPAFRACIDAWQVDPFVRTRLRWTILSASFLIYRVCRSIWRWFRVSLRRPLSKIRRFAGQCLANSIDDVEIIDEGRRCIHEM